MRVLIAIDSFKGSASSSELACEIEKGILRVYENCQIDSCIIADGGEGTVEALSLTKKVQSVKVLCSDPLENKIESIYNISQDNIALIEMASASGLPLVPLKKRDPSITTSYGTGDLIKDAIKKGIRKFIVGIGGSATNDAGIGMLRSLGFKFLDELGNEIFYAKDLDKIVFIDESCRLKELDECTFKVACDVNNPLCGENGATFVYAKQKGANEDMLIDLDNKLNYFSNLVESIKCKRLKDIKGAGAAGGVGFGFLAFLNASLESGIKIVLEQMDFKNKVKNVDIVITGEGKIDKQSSMGKVINGVAKVCKEERVTCIALSGNSSEASENLYEDGISACFSILNEPISLENAMKKDVTLDLIGKKTEQIFRLIKSSAKI